MLPPVGDDQSTHVKPVVPPVEVAPVQMSVVTDKVDEDESANDKTVPELLRAVDHEVAICDFIP